MRIEYYSATDERLADHYGGKVCAEDNKHHLWDVDLKPFDDGKIVWVKVSIQNLGHRRRLAHGRLAQRGVCDQADRVVRRRRRLPAARTEVTRQATASSTDGKMA